MQFCLLHPISSRTPGYNHADYLKSNLWLLCGIKIAFVFYLISDVLLSVCICLAHGSCG